MIISFLIISSWEQSSSRKEFEKDLFWRWKENFKYKKWKKEAHLYVFVLELSTWYFWQYIGMLSRRHIIFERKHLAEDSMSLSLRFVSLFPAVASSALILETKRVSFSIFSWLLSFIFIIIFSTTTSSCISNKSMEESVTRDKKVERKWIKMKESAGNQPSY